MRHLIPIILIAALAACEPVDAAPDSGIAAEPIALGDGGESDAGDPCVDPRIAYPTCASCHEEAETPAGWYSGGDPCVEGDTWGRWAFFVLFDGSRTATVPEHRAPYDTAESCFCVVDEENRRCLTLAGAYERDPNCR